MHALKGCKTVQNVYGWYCIETEPIACIKACVLVLPLVHAFQFWYISFILIIYNINNASVFLLVYPSGTL